MKRRRYPYGSARRVVFCLVTVAIGMMINATANHADPELDYNSIMDVNNHDLHNNASRNITLGMVSGDSAFFDPVQVGWETQCEALGTNVQCIYLKPNWTEFYATQEDMQQQYAHPCIPLMEQLLDMGVDGLAAKCIYDDVDIWQRAADLDIPLVAFDGPPPDDFDVSIDAYIGTDQSFMGRTMARLLKQLRPEGGTFGLVYRPEHMDRVESFRDELTLDNRRNDRSHWYEIEPVDSQNPDDTGTHLINDPTRDFSSEVMQRLAVQDPTSIIFMYQTPMRAHNYTDFIDLYRDRNITFIGTDGADYQLAYLTRRFVDGLVGQLPYDMGAFSANKLYELVSAQMDEEYKQQTKDQLPDQTLRENDAAIPSAASQGQRVVTMEVIPTNLVAYNLIPTELPPLDLEENLLGNLVYIGFSSFGILAVCSLVCIVWTLQNYHAAVVRASQPVFLLMTVVGILLMASSLIPLSFDDQGEPEKMDPSFAVGICMSIPWLAFVGFTVTFSALFSKTWRVNKLFQSASAFGRIRVSEGDVLMPFAILLTLNIVVLICWTIIDPLTYERQFESGTDFWNREYQSIGTCSSDHSVAFLTPLALVNFGVVVTACWQAWQARDIKSEFSEAKYIGLAVFSMCQAFLTGIPIVAIVRDIPQAFYLVLTFLIFTLCMVVLMLIFLPKMIMHRQYARLSEAEQKKALQMSLQQSQAQQSCSRLSPGRQTYAPKLHQSHVSALSDSISNAPNEGSSIRASRRNRSIRFSLDMSLKGARRSIDTAGMRHSIDMKSIDEMTERNDEDLDNQNMDENDNNLTVSTLREATNPDKEYLVESSLSEGGQDQDGDHITSSSP